MLLLGNVGSPSIFAFLYVDLSAGVERTTSAVGLSFPFGLRRRRLRTVFLRGLAPFLRCRLAMPALPACLYYGTNFF